MFGSRGFGWFLIVTNALAAVGNILLGNFLPAFVNAVAAVGAYWTLEW